MSEENYKLWKLAAVTCCVSIMSMSGCTMHRSYTIQQLVAGGADPMRSACAISDKCLIVAARSGEVAHD